MYSICQTGAASAEVILVQRIWRAGVGNGIARNTDRSGNFLGAAYLDGEGNFRWLIYQTGGAELDE
jgi:hypothetical protein